jgi:hypothetical protein
VLMLYFLAAGLFESFMHKVNARLMVDARAKEILSQSFLATYCRILAAQFSVLQPLLQLYLGFGQGCLDSILREGNSSDLRYTLAAELEHNSATV